MSEASARKLAEIKARVEAGMTLYDLRRECIEYLMMGLYETYGPDDGEQDNGNAKANAANAVQHGNLVISVVNRLKDFARNVVKLEGNLVL